MTDKKVEAENENKGPEVGEMKKGDYMIHIYIQQAKQIKSATYEIVNPVIEITCLEKKKYTNTKKDVGPTSTLNWSEHIFFEPKNLIQIRVLNKGLLKDELLGIYINFVNKYIAAYEFDVTFIYFQNKHAIFHQWIGMSNPESKDFNEITCYLKLSISIAGQGDEQVALNDESGPEKTEESTILMPPSIKKEFKQVKIRFIKGEKFPQMDIMGTIDAYFQTVFFKKKLKTKPVTQSKSGDCPIEQEFWLPIQWPMASDRLIIKLFDEDKAMDEIVGSMFFSLKQIVTECGSEGVMKWINLYGSPLGVSGANTDKMNDNPEFASTWKGRTLMHLSAFDTKSPENKINPLDPDIKTLAQKSGMYINDDYQIMVEFGSGVCLPGDKKYKLRVCINDFCIESQNPKEAKQGYCRWSERTEPLTYQAPYKSVEELDRIYIYLVDGNEPVCYWKGQAKDFIDPNPSYQWFPLTCDLAKGKVTKIYEAGLVQLKITINHKTKNGAVDFKQYDAWKKPPPKRLNTYKIRIYLFQCKDIPSADSDGTSDPYVTVWNAENKVIKTQVVEDNLNPIFFEALEVMYDYNSLQDAPPIVLNVWDKDEMLDADDYLGRCVIKLNEASISEDDTIPIPKWHDMRMGFSDKDPVCGQMLVSFSVVESDYTFKIPLAYLKLTEQIEYKEYSVEINVLGLRELQSFGLLPVKKPYIRFQLRSLLPPEKSQAATNVSTAPSATGSNPNINTVINFQIDLPVNPLFCPKLQCDVFDYVYKGFVQPLLGTFTIGIGDIMHRENEKKKLYMTDSENLITMLNDRRKQLELEQSPEHRAQGIEEEIKEDIGGVLDVEKRVQAFDRLAEGQTTSLLESSRLMTEAGTDKAKLIQEGPSITDQSFGDLTHIKAGPGMLGAQQIIGEEEKQIQQVIPKEAPKLILGSSPSKSPVEGRKTPADMTPGTFKKQALAKGNVFKLGNKLKSEVEIGLNYKFRQQKAIQRELELQQKKEQREQDKLVIKQFSDGHKNIIYPQYAYDERLKIKREVNKPPETLFMGLGYNDVAPDTPEEEKKHYRKYYEDELENCEDIFTESPFYTVDVVRGQSRGASSGFFSFFSAPKTDESGEVTTKKVVGQFKGKITIVNKEENDSYMTQKKTRTEQIISLLKTIHEVMFKQPLQFQISDLENFEETQKFSATLEKMELEPHSIVSFLKEQSYTEMISRMMMIKTKCIVRLYVLEGYDFAQRDIGSFSDPYLVMKCGKRKYNERDNYQLDEPNPKFYKMYEFDAEFPGAPKLSIKAYDYDDLFGDDLIGQTSIDLDDRFFCPEWQQIEDKPIEFRQLYHPSTSLSQGVIKCWVELHVTSKNTAKVWDVTPIPQKDYQVRLVVYDAVDVVPADIEGTSDCFIKAFMENNDKKETDTHYRCTNKKPSWNYRLLFNVKAPRKDHNLNIQIWDRDLFKSNDFSGEMQLDLGLLFEDVMATQKPITLTKKYFNAVFKDTLREDQKIEFYDDDSFYVNCLNSKGDIMGRVRIGLNITPGEMAAANKVGEGRTEPNHSPFLPPPVGRLSFTLNPFAMFNQLVGPEIRRKVYTYCCLGLCIMLCIALIPLIAGNLASALIIKIF